MIKTLIKELNKNMLKVIYLIYKIKKNSINKNVKIIFYICFYFFVKYIKLNKWKGYYLITKSKVVGLNYLKRLFWGNDLDTRWV